MAPKIKYDKICFKNQQWHQILKFFRFVIFFMKNWVSYLVIKIEYMANIIVVSDSSERKNTSRPMYSFTD